MTPHTSPALSFAEFLEGDAGRGRRSSLRSDINAIARIQERLSQHSDWTSLAGWTELDAAVQKRLLKAFPAGRHEMLDLMTGGHAADIGVQVENPMELGITDGGNSERFNILWRKFLFDVNVLELKEIKIDAGFQGEGLGTRILEGTLEVAQRLGFKWLLLDACYMGSYVWARAGFLPLNKANCVNFFKQVGPRLDEEASAGRASGKTDADLEAFLAEAGKIVESGLRGDDLAFWRLADLEYERPPGTKLAKQLMRDICWIGALDVNDPAQVERLKAYAKSRA